MNMKFYATKLLAKVSLLLLLGVQAAAVNAEPLEVDIDSAYRYELLQELSTNVEALYQENKVIQTQNTSATEKEERQEQDTSGKSVSYFSILGVIISDALMEATRDTNQDVYVYKEVGLINP